MNPERNAQQQVNARRADALEDRRFWKKVAIIAAIAIIAGIAYLVYAMKNAVGGG